MKNTYIYVTFLSVLGLTSCDFDQPVEDTPIAIQESGGADFSNYVAIGASITAGFADGALYTDGQEVGFPNLLASQMEAAGGGEFNIPFMQDNIGGFAGVFEDELDDDGNQVPVFGTRLVLSGNPTGDNAAPVRSNNNEPQNDISNLISGLYNNIGVPGAKSFHAVADTYAAANPYYGRMATSASSTMLGDALTQNPTFFSVWLGGNDVLSYATSGGTGINQLGNLDPSTYGIDDITDPNVFGSVLSNVISSFTDSGASGVVFNVPSVTDLPFFTTVPNNALVLDAEQAANLTGFFQAYAAIFAGGLTQRLVTDNGLDLATASGAANALAAQYAITFNEGPNRFLISVDVTTENPQGFRQMTEEEFLLLTIDTGALAEEGYGSIVLTNEVLAVLGALQAGATPTPEEGLLVLSAVNPINDEDALDSFEMEEIADATISFNTTLDNIASVNENIVIFDANARLTELSTTGLNFEGGTIFAALGSGFSLDGIHLSPRGNAVFANAVIDDINSFFGSTLQPVIPINFGTVTLE